MASLLQSAGLTRLSAKSNRTTSTCPYRQASTISGRNVSHGTLRACDCVFEKGNLSVRVYRTDRLRPQMYYVKLGELNRLSDKRRRTTLT